MTPASPRGCYNYYSDTLAVPRRMGSGAASSARRSARSRVPTSGALRAACGRPGCAGTAGPHEGSSVRGGAAWRAPQRAPDGGGVCSGLDCAAARRRPPVLPRRDARCARPRRHDRFGVAGRPCSLAVASYADARSTAHIGSQGEGRPRSTCGNGVGAASAVPCSHWKRGRNAERRCKQALEASGAEHQRVLDASERHEAGRVHWATESGRG